MCAGFKDQFGYCLGVDVGTSGTKALLLSPLGSVAASATECYPLYQPNNGWAEQDPEDWYRAAVNAIKKVLAESGIAPQNIAAVGLTGQMHGLVMLSDSGKVLRRAIIWCDQRTAAECDEITRRVGADRLIELTANPALTGFTAGKLLWVCNHEPETYAECSHILLPKDYIRYRLTGDFATDVSDASGMQLLDVAKRRWSSEVQDALELKSGLLPEVYESPEVTGRISETAARETGLATATAVVAGAGDNAAAAVGVGVVREGAAFTTIGTSGVVFAHTDKMVTDKRCRVHTFCCAVPGAWHVMGVTQAAGLSLQWFRDKFCAEEMEKARKTGKSAYELMDEEAFSVPAGSNRLLYLPYLMGERTPHLDPDCRGVFFGLSAIHTKNDMIRAVMEGVAYSLNDCKNVLREMGVSSPSMLVCGGGSKSALWRRIIADVYGNGISTVRCEEGPSLGAALLAAVGVGLFPSVQSACDSVVKLKDTTKPDADDAAKYKRYYALYQSIYPALKKQFGELALL